MKTGVLPADEKIVVKGHRVFIRKDSTRDTTIVKGEKLRESSSASIFETLSHESGDIYVTSRGVSLHGVASGSTGGIYIRGLGGFPNSQILIVEDGVPDYQGIFGHPIPDAYIPDLIDKTLVIKGGDSVLFGTNAMGGVVIMNTRWRKSDGMDIFSDFSTGSYNTIKNSIAMLSRTGVWDASAALSVFETDGHRDGAQGSKLVGMLSSRWRLGNSMILSARSRIMHISGADPGPVTHPTPDNWYDVWRGSVSAGFSIKKSIFTMNLIPYLNLGQHKLYDGFKSIDVVSGAILESRFRFSKELCLISGTGVEIVDGHVENRISDEYTSIDSRISPALYSQLTYKPFSQTEAVTGGRIILDESEGPVFLYKAGLSQVLLDYFRLSTGISRNFRNPTLRELYLPYPVANPDLKPEYSLNWNATIRFITDIFDISSTVYRTSARNLIKYFGSWPTAEVVNIDSYTVWGVEGKVRIKNIFGFSPFIMGNFQDVGRYTKQNPDGKVDFGIDFTRKFGLNSLKITVSAQYIHGLYMDNYSRNPMDDVFYIDGSIRYRYILSGRKISIEPYLILRNLLDNQYAFVEGYTMPGFNILAGVKIGI